MWLQMTPDEPFACSGLWAADAVGCQGSPAGYRLLPYHAGLPVDHGATWRRRISSIIRDSPWRWPGVTVEAIWRSEGF